MPNFSIRRMKSNEIQLAIDWARIEGWNPGQNDADCFYKADPHGFFIGLIDQEPIATGAAIAYDDRFAFCGLYIVKKNFRHQGFGMKLTEERLKYLGNRITGIDGVLENITQYEKIGYKSAYKNIRFEGKPLAAKLPSEVVDLTKIPFADLEAFDRRFFSAKRSNFLKGWITQSQSRALGFFQGNLKGYGVIRKCYHGYKIGPLFAHSPEIAATLYEALCSQVKEGPIYLDIPEYNQAFAHKYELKPVFQLMRMYRNGFPDTELEGVYGITTSEVG